MVTPHGLFAAGDFESTSMEYFRTSLPEPGSGYIYDAVMAVGLGACIAEQEIRLAGSDTASISSKEQVEGIRATNFSGATGHVEFGVTLGIFGNITSSRQSSLMTVGVFNLFPPQSDLESASGYD